MVRVRALRVGYASLAASLLFLSAGVLDALSSLVLLAPLAALVGAVFLAFSADELPKWAGLTLLVYAAIMLAVFLAANPITIRTGGFRGFLNGEPWPLAQAIMEYLLLALPLMLAATALVAAWERENAPRLLLAGAIAGLLAFAVLSVVLVPRGASGGPEVSADNDTAADDELATAQRDTQVQAALLKILVALSCISGAAGAAWSAARPEEYH